MFKNLKKIIKNRQKILVNWAKFKFGLKKIVHQGPAKKGPNK